MTTLESTIKTVLAQLKPDLASETWESRRRYFNQMLRCADSLGISKPCQELYDAFIADDNGSSERRELHVRCVKLVDALAGTEVKDDHGVLFNEPPMPHETEVIEFFHDRHFPVTQDVRIDYLIIKAEIEMRGLNLTTSTVGQYKHSWMDIRRYFYDAGTAEYDEELLHRFIRETDSYYANGSIKEWKRKINRKAAHVLLEVAGTGRFNWGLINRNTSCGSLEIESIRTQYLESLKQRNLSKSTIDLHDYVFRKAMEFVGAGTRSDLSSLSPDEIHLTVKRFADICNRRSIATIIPILRSLLTYLHAADLIATDLSGIVMGAFVQRGSAASYISKKDQANLLSKLAEEPKRTNAVILLAMKLGLRDCDICNLTFEQIDWHRDKIRLNQTKTGDPLVLPLLPDVGNALMDYIMNERPKLGNRYPYIFIRKQAPYNKLRSVYPICSKLLDRQKIKPINGTAKGTHLLRYSLVHRLLAAKVPKQVITDTLGHASKESDTLNQLMHRIALGT